MGHPEERGGGISHMGNDRAIPGVEQEEREVHAWKIHRYGPERTGRCVESQASVGKMERWKDSSADAIGSDKTS